MTELRSLALFCQKKMMSKLIKCSRLNILHFTVRYFDLVRDVRQNKGSILKASVDYIKKLKVDQDRKVFLEEKCKKQEYQNKKLLLKLQVESSSLY